MEAVAMVEVAVRVGLFLFGKRRSLGNPCGRGVLSLQILLLSLSVFGDLAFLGGEGGRE